MQNSTILNINEDDINKMNKYLLERLLLDRTTRNPILWATDDYADLGSDYKAGCWITKELITGSNAKVIQPSVLA